MSKRKKVLPPVKYLRECFDFDSDSGILRWKKQRPREHFTTAKGWKIWHVSWAGKETGNLNVQGYLQISLDHRRYFSHRVIWKMLTGKEPPLSIDHIDDNRSNNRWSNLRATAWARELASYDRARAAWKSRSSACAGDQP